MIEIPDCQGNRKAAVESILFEYVPNMVASVELTRVGQDQNTGWVSSGASPVAQLSWPSTPLGLVYGSLECLLPDWGCPVRVA